MKSKITAALILLVLTVSCGEYEKILKSTDYELKKNKAIEYYEAGKYIKASELLSVALPRYRATDEAEYMTWIGAKSYYGMRDYLTASAAFRNYSETFPYSENAEEATFMAAYCDYLQSPRPELDQSMTVTAIEGFIYFQRRFPISDKMEQSSVLIKELEDKLVEKSFIGAKLYYDLGEYRAAIVALANSLKEYPDTRYREEMMFLRLESTYLFALRSVADKQQERYQEVLDEYYSFIEEFPDTKYNRDVERIHSSTAQFLKLDVNN